MPMMATISPPKNETEANVWSAAGLSTRATVLPIPITPAMTNNAPGKY